MFKQVTAHELAGRLGSSQEPFVLDVREPDEVAEWAIPGAVNVPLNDLPRRAGEVPQDRQVVVVCASGNRSSKATEALDRAGWNVANLTGGMRAWGRVYDTAVVDAGDAQIVQVRRRGKGCLSYVIGSGNDAVVVDPSADLDVYLGVAAEHGWTIRHVFDTHLHADHLSGARDLADTVGATLHLNPADTFHFPYEPLHDGQVFSLSGGAELRVAAMHTPGHTEGSTMYFVGDRAVLTGDTLFVDGVGRPDLAERAVEFARNLHHSLHTKVLPLPGDATVLPGHFGDEVRVRPDAPVGAPVRELTDRLPELRLGEDEFVDWAAARSTPRPPNYVEIIKANMGRPESPLGVLQQLEMGPNRCSA